MASEFDIDSSIGQGTALVACVWDHSCTGTVSDSVVTGVIHLAIRGETVSGCLSVRIVREATSLRDSGWAGTWPLAAQAPGVAIESLRAHGDRPLIEQVELAHGALSQQGCWSGGDSARRHIVKFVGVGNIMAAVCQDGSSRRMVSQDGILGFN